MPGTEPTAKQLKKQRRRERQAAEAALLAKAEAEAARVAEELAEAERVAVAAAEEARIAAARAAKAEKRARCAAERAEKLAQIEALPPEERAAYELAKAEKAAKESAEKQSGEVRRVDALAILNKNPIFSKFLPLEIGGGKKLAAWAFERGKGAISMKAAREIVAAHCRHPRYLKHILKRFKRYDPISWQPVGEVTQEQKDFARLKLKRQREMLLETLPNVIEVEVLPETLPDVTETQEQGDNQG
jgi:hypothetical protein